MEKEKQEEVEMLILIDKWAPFVSRQNRLPF